MKNTIVDILKMDTPKELEVSGWIKSFEKSIYRFERRIMFCACKSWLNRKNSQKNY